MVCISACAFTSSQPAHKAGLLTRRPPYDQSRKLRRGAGAAVLSSMQFWATCSCSSPVPAAVFATFHQCTCHGPCLVLHLGGSDRTQLTMAVSSAWSLGVPRTGLLSLPGPGENCGSCFHKRHIPVCCTWHGLSPEPQARTVVHSGKFHKLHTASCPHPPPPTASRGNSDTLAPAIRNSSFLHASCHPGSKVIPSPGALARVVNVALWESSWIARLSSRRSSNTLRIQCHMTPPSFQRPIWPGRAATLEDL